MRTLVLLVIFPLIIACTPTTYDHGVPNLLSSKNITMAMAGANVQVTRELSCRR